MSIGICIAAVAPLLMIYSGCGFLQSDGQPSVSGSMDDSREMMMGSDTVSKDVLGYEIEMIDGSMRSLEDFRGRVVLMVNVASKCGLTGQYEGLEAMYQKHKDDGLVIIGFPANEFGSQEPGSNEEIAAFCEKNYGVSFPMAAKIVVKGEGIHPLYKQLTSQPEPVGGEISWNFDKFIVDRKGEVVSRFKPLTKPSSKKLVREVERLLAES